MASIASGDDGYATASYSSWSYPDTPEPDDHSPEAEAVRRQRQAQAERAVQTTSFSPNLTLPDASSMSYFGIGSCTPSSGRHTSMLSAAGPGDHLVRAIRKRKWEADEAVMRKQLGRSRSLNALLKRMAIKNNSPDESYLAKSTEASTILSHPFSCYILDKALYKAHAAFWHGDPGAGKFAEAAIRKGLTDAVAVVPLAIGTLLKRRILESQYASCFELDIEERDRFLNAKENWNYEQYGSIITLEQTERFCASKSNWPFVNALAGCLSTIHNVFEQMVTG